MAGLLDDTYENAKILLVGDQGNGKTGAKAALVALGYKLLMFDSDAGFKILRSLLTDRRYPYADYMKRHGVKPEENISFIPIEVPFDTETQLVKRGNGNISFEVLGPTSSSAWSLIFKYLKEWKDQGKNWGGVQDWDNDVVLDFDTLSTLAEVAKYWVQDMNNRLGSLTDDHGRDTGGAQEMVTRLVRKMSATQVRCNVIFTCHIKRVDMSLDVPQSVEARLRDKKPVEVVGFPAIIGQAISPFIGKRFNDQFVVKRDERGKEARIYTTPIDGVMTKNSAWLEDSYPVKTGLAHIFAALNYKTVPEDFDEAILGKGGNNNGHSQEGGGGGFGRK